MVAKMGQDSVAHHNSKSLPVHNLDAGVLSAMTFTATYGFEERWDTGSEDTKCRSNDGEDASGNVVDIGQERQD